jgi:hypothetical protein
MGSGRIATRRVLQPTAWEFRDIETLVEPLGDPRPLVVESIEAAMLDVAGLSVPFLEIEPLRLDPLREDAGRSPPGK